MNEHRENLGRGQPRVTCDYCYGRRGAEDKYGNAICRECSKIVGAPWCVGCRDEATVIAYGEWLCEGCEREDRADRLAEKGRPLNCSFKRGYGDTVREWARRFRDEADADRAQGRLWTGSPPA